MKNFKSLFLLLLCCSFIVFQSCEKEEDETVLVDCPGLELNIGDACIFVELNGDTYTGTLNENCVCISDFPTDTTNVLDCPMLFGNFGELCETPNVPMGGTISENCECIPFDFDCIQYQANVGETCLVIDTLGNIITGILNDNCFCEADEIPVFDCPELQSNYEWDCVTANFEQGFVNGNCECEPYYTGNNFDCIQYEANIGESCFVVEPNGDTYTGTLNANCECISDFPTDTTNVLDCPQLFGNFGDLCETPEVPMGGTINQNCECIPFDFDCIQYQANVGDICITYNPNGVVIYGVLSEDCICE